jgi:hypothetical protein
MLRTHRVSCTVQIITVLSNEASPAILQPCRTINKLPHTPASQSYLKNQFLDGVLDVSSPTPDLLIDGAIDFSCPTPSLLIVACSLGSLLFA